MNLAFFAGLSVTLAQEAREQPVQQSLALYLNDPTDKTQPQESCTVPLCRALLERIEAAEESIDFAIYGLHNQSPIFEALLAAQKRGVRVRGVVDYDANGRSYYTDTPRLVESLGTLGHDAEHDRRERERRKGQSFWRGRCWIPDEFQGPLQCLEYDLGDRCLKTAHASREPIEFEGNIQHNKFFVFDGAWVWTGSTNISDSGTGGYNANLALVVESRKLAWWFSREFWQMWKEQRFHTDKRSLGRMKTTLADGTKVRLLFSPADDPIETAVLPLLRKTRKSMDVAIFFLTHKEITRELLRAHQRGVQVRVILDATAAKNEYSKHEILRAGGIPVKVEDWGGKMHAKSAVLDGRVLIVGSMNWTRSGTQVNDENTLLIESFQHAQLYQAWFDKLWASIPDRWLEGQPDPESRESGTSCTDGVDNDFDDLADARDPGCSDNPPALPGKPPQRILPKQEGQGLIKGNIEAAGYRRYYTRWHPDYEKVLIDSEQGEQFFCNESDAKAAGWKKAGP